jgi:hypothetical protein
LDGNFVSGDATVIFDDRAFAPDAASRDAEPDAAADAEHEDAIDAGPDAEPADTAEAAPDALPVDSACNEAPAVVVTTTEAIARSAMLEGMIIDLAGTATVGRESCTHDACGDGGSCCNACTATVSIDGVVPLVSSECIAFRSGCAGNECALACRPPVIGVPQRFRGRLGADRANGGVLLELFEVLP